MHIITVCESQISQDLCKYAKESIEEKVEIRQIDSLNICIDLLSETNIDFLVLQMSSPLWQLQDFLHDLQERKLTIDILLFQTVNQITIYFTTTTCQNVRLSKIVSEYFINALNGKYHCFYMSYQNPIWNQRFHQDEAGPKKREMLLEFCRGVTTEEYQPLKNQYDLRNNGYHLFVWELPNSEFPNYQANKNIYYFINEVQEEEYYSVLHSGSGGEVLMINLSLAVILFNDYASKSATRRLAELQKMKNSLASVGNCRGACQFMSEYIREVEDIYKGYESYQKSRPYRFFCREIFILTFENIESRHKWIPDEFIDETLRNIKDTIRYDIGNEKLPILIRRIFLDIIKPSMSYTLYYTLSDAIHSMLKNEMAVRDLRDALDNPDLLSSIQLSSIEEKCDEMLRFIQSLRHQLVNKSFIRNAIILKSINYINENYFLDITIPQIALALNVSRAYLTQHFKAEIGIGIKRYMTNTRIEKAKEILVTTDNPIDLVASSVGFSDFRHFSKTFKQITDFSPSQFRKRNTSSSAPNLSSCEKSINLKVCTEI